MDGVGCHANVVACHRDGLDVIVTCLAAIHMVLGVIAIATCWNAICMGLVAIVACWEAIEMGLNVIETCRETICWSDMP